MEIKLNVKNKSVQTFLEEMLLGYKPNERNGNGTYSESSAHYLIKDEMFFKKDCGINVGETIKIELYDRSHISGKDLTNIYLYKAEKYDDVAIKMVLTNFSIELNNGN
jgi:hypothetical protein